MLEPKTLADYLGRIQVLAEARPDPAYASLLKVVSDHEIPDPDSISGGVFLLDAATYWEQADKGALWGALYFAVPDTFDGDWPYGADSPDIAAAQAVAGWMEGRAK